MENLNRERLIAENRKRSEYLKKKWPKEIYDPNKAVQDAIKEHEELYTTFIKNDGNCTDITYEEIPEVMYHISPRHNREFVLACGPRTTKNSTRSYFFNSIESAQNFLENFNDDFDCLVMEKNAILDYRWLRDLEPYNPSKFFTLSHICRYMIQLMPDDERIRYFGR